MTGLEALRKPVEDSTGADHPKAPGVPKEYQQRISLATTGPGGNTGVKFIKS